MPYSSCVRHRYVWRRDKVSWGKSRPPRALACTRSTAQRQWTFYLPIVVVIALPCSGSRITFGGRRYWGLWVWWLVGCDGLAKRQHGVRTRASPSHRISYHLCLIKANDVQATTLGSASKVCSNCFLNARHLLSQQMSTNIKASGPQAEPVHSDTWQLERINKEILLNIENLQIVNK